MTAAGDRSSARPGDGLLHPIALGALVVLVVNDQVLKEAWPGPLTGILSDVAGLIVAPLAAVAAWEIGAWVIGRWGGPSRVALAVAIVLVGTAFALVQLWSPLTDVYRVGLGVVQWPFAAFGAIVSGASMPPVRPVIAVADAEDLLALPALAVSWWVGTRRAPRRSR